MLDISDILEDGDFRISFEIERRKATTDIHGINHVEGTRMEMSGCIQPATAKELERLPEADRVRETVMVYSTIPFMESNQEYNPDLVFWQNRVYEVVSVESWPGWNRAFAQLLPECALEQ